MDGPKAMDTAQVAAPDAAVSAALRHGHLIQASRARWADADLRDRWTLRVGALAFAVPAALLAATAGWSGVRPGVLLLAIPALALASSVELELGSAAAVPSEPVVVAMLLMLPAGVVPLATFAALLLASGWVRFRGGRQDSPAVTACSSAFVIGPALVVQMLGLGPVGPRWWAVVALAYAAQIASDLAVSWWRNCVGLGLAFGEVVEMLRWSYSIDLLLAPGAIAAVIALHGSPVALLLALCPVALIAVLARDRARHIDHVISLGDAYSDAAATARRDPLTGLGNRLAWDEAMATEEVEAHEQVGVLMLDVDHLKWVNDLHGHDAGDRLLTVVGHVVGEVAAEVTASAGAACRVGGDEFAVLVPDASTDDMARLATIVTKALALRPPIGDVPVSASIGFASARGGMVVDAARDADQRMYQAKQLRPPTRPDVARPAASTLDPISL